MRFSETYSDLRPCGCRREAKDTLSGPSSEPAPRPESICLACWTTTVRGRSYCRSCAIPVATEHLTEVGERGRAAGRIAAHSADAHARLANTQRRHAMAKSAWQPSSLPAWLNEETYLGKIQPLLAGFTNKAIASTLGSSIPYASVIRAGDVFRIHGTGRRSRDSGAFRRIAGCGCWKVLICTAFDGRIQNNCLMRHEFYNTLFLVLVAVAVGAIFRLHVSGQTTSDKNYQNCLNGWPGMSRICSHLYAAAG